MKKLNRKNADIADQIQQSHAYSKKLKADIRSITLSDKVRKTRSTSRGRSRSPMNTKRSNKNMADLASLMNTQRSSKNIPDLAMTMNTQRSNKNSLFESIPEWKTYV